MLFGRPCNGIDIFTAVCVRVATESVLALLRNPEYAVYGASKVRKEAGLDAGEDVFNEVSLQERGKFKEETLVNVGGRSRSKRLSRCGLGFAMGCLLTFCVNNNFVQGCHCQA